MRIDRSGSAVAALFLLAACDSTDRAVFVTTTNIGINADATARVVNIGYDRTEGFIGPAYVETGVVPQVVGYLHSNLGIIEPQVKQLYATGEAASIVTAIKVPPEEKAKKASGTRRTMFFGTASNIGLKVGFAGDVPDSINFGYKRKEASAIPLQASNPVDPKEDVYGSVLASIDMSATAKSFSGTGIEIAQFVATGAAAQNLARHEEIRGIFRAKAAEAVSAGAADAELLKKQSKTFATCVKPGGGSLDAAARARRDAIVARAQASGMKPGAAALLRAATSAQELEDLVTGALNTSGPMLDAEIKKDPTICT